MMGTWSRMFSLNVSRDASYSPNMDAFSARTACSATTRELVGFLSTTGRMKSGIVPLDSAILIACPFRLRPLFAAAVRAGSRTVW